MTTANQIYTRFHAAILANDAAPALPDIQETKTLSAVQRMNIYIDAYRLRLTAALRADYPTLCYALGDAAFEQHALAYINAHPPQSYSLDDYSAGFTGAFTGKDFLHDLARLEQAITLVFNGPESAPLTLEYMQGLSPDAVAELQLSPRAASRLLAFDYDVNDYLQLFRAGSAPAIPQPKPTYLYLYRHAHEVQRAVLAPAAYELLRHLFSGETLDAAITHASTIYPDDLAANFQNWFAEWIQQGFFVAT
jgi:hypothetical protein